MLERVASGSFHDPHSVLGAHIHQGALTVRSLRPFAASVAVVLPDGDRVPMEHEFDGIWATVLPTPQVPDYRVAVTYEGVGETVVDEPYRYLPTLGEIDLHLIREGRHEQLWDVLGAHVRRYPGSRAFDAIGEVTGTSFAVWAPNAQAVRVVGDFNHWVGRGHAMRSLGDSGVWELFIPDVGQGRGTSTRSSAGTGTGGRRPTRWRSPRRSRRRRRASSPSPPTSGRTTSG